jgi:hypothetical protein
MATSKPLATLPLPDAPVMRAWHVTLSNGGGHTVAAHKCSILSGALSFWNLFPPRKKAILVYACGPGTWSDAQLVAVDPVDVAIAHQPPPPELVEHGVRWR